jgi:hypothetical protein
VKSLTNKAVERRNLVATRRAARGKVPKDVKNEGRSGDMYENKGGGDKMPDHISGISTQSGKIIRAFLHSQTQISQVSTGINATFRSKEHKL